MVFTNDGNEPVGDIVRRILVFMPENEKDLDREYWYWNAYYKGIAGKK